jgi:hypothetical protein
MPLDLWIPALVWLAIGAAIAIYLYRLMQREGKVEPLWVVIGLLLSVLGLMAFIGVRSMRERGRDKAVDPKSYQPPEYKLKEGEGKEMVKTEPAPEPRPKKEVKRIDGIPRCPECGAAVSSLDERCRECGAKLRK